MHPMRAHLRGASRFGARMKRTTVCIGVNSFVLPVDTDLSALTARIESKIRLGGGFIDIDLTDDRTISVLVSSAIPVFIEIQEIDVDENDDGAGDPEPGVDYDLDYDFEAPLPRPPLSAVKPLTPVVDLKTASRTDADPSRRQDEG